MYASPVVLPAIELFSTSLSIVCGGYNSMMETNPFSDYCSTINKDFEIALGVLCLKGLVANINFTSICPICEYANCIEKSSFDGSYS